jgi:dephospho-CoA kinase
MKNIAISGKMTSGKTTIAEELKKNYGYEIITIATPIKKTCNLLIEDQEELKEYFNRTLTKDQDEVYVKMTKAYYENFKNAVWEKEANGFYKKNEWYRKLTQDVGNIMREKFGEDVWCSMLLESVKKDMQEGKKLVCDDVRLIVEKNLFQQNDFEVIRLNISEEAQKKRVFEKYGDVPEAQLKHRTEVELDNEKFPLVIDTDKMSVEESVGKIVEKLF